MHDAAIKGDFWHLGGIPLKFASGHNPSKFRLEMAMPQAYFTVKSKLRKQPIAPSSLRCPTFLLRDAPQRKARYCN